MPETTGLPISRKTATILIVVVVLLSLLSTFFGYSYKKVTKQRDELKVEVSTLDKKLRSKYSFTEVKEPVLLDGKIVYKTTTKYITSTSASSSSTHSSSVSIVTKTVTVTKKDFATFGLGTNLDRDACLLIQRDVLSTPIGSLGLSITPNITSFKKSCIFITYKP